MHYLWSLLLSIGLMGSCGIRAMAPQAESDQDTQEKAGETPYDRDKTPERSKWASIKGVTRVLGLSKGSADSSPSKRRASHSDLGVSQSDEAAAVCKRTGLSGKVVDDTFLAEVQAEINALKMAKAEGGSDSRTSSPAITERGRSSSASSPVVTGRKADSPSVRTRNTYPKTPGRKESSPSSSMAISGRHSS